MQEKIWKINDKQWIGTINVYTNSRYDENGIDKHGFNKEGIHVITRGRFDENGYDRFGFDENMVNKYGIDINGRFAVGSLSNYTIKYIRMQYRRLNRIIDILASEHAMYLLYSEKFPILSIKQNERVFDENGIDKYGFNKEGIHVITNITLDNYGYNALGYNALGYDRNGYDIYGYDEQNYDEYGYNTVGRDIQGYDREGYDREGYDENGIDKHGIKRPEKILSGKEEREIEENKIKRRNNYLGLISKAEKLSKGELSLEEYVKTSKTSIEDLIEFAKKQKMSADIVRGLSKYKKPYSVYKKQFFKEQYLKVTILIIDGKEVKPTEEDVDKCIEYLKVNDYLICDKTVRDTVKSYLKGELDINIKNEENRKLLAKEIIEQQNKIKTQEAEISELKAQRRSLDE